MQNTVEPDNLLTGCEAYKNSICINLFASKSLYPQWWICNWLKCYFPVNYFDVDPIPLYAMGFFTMVMYICMHLLN